MYATAAAWILLAQRWKEDKIPTIVEWLLKMMDYAEMAKFTENLRDNDIEKFKKEWEAFIVYVQKYCKQVEALAGFD